MQFGDVDIMRSDAGACVGLPRRRLRAALYRNRRLGGAGQDGVARVVVVSGVPAGKRRERDFSA